MQKHRLFILLGLLFAFSQQLHAQLKVDMHLDGDRDLFIVYEPVMVTVSITNLSGHDLTLDNADGQKWFSFQVVQATQDTANPERIIPPIVLDYKLDPLVIPAGKSIKRSLNLSALYSVQDFGLYRVKASVYSGETQKYYSSEQENFQIAEGRMFWQETVGVPEGHLDQQGRPDGGSHRTLSLLTFRGPKDNMLYVRVEDKDAGVVYTTNPLGRVLTENDPDVLLDKSNLLHVLQLVGSRTYVYSRVGLNGEWYSQLTYNAAVSRPVLKKTSEGDVIVSGGQLDVPVSPTAPGVPKILDRPPGFPQAGN